MATNEIMKIKPEDYEKIKSAVQHVLDKRPDAMQVYIDSGKTAKRFRWDVLYASGLKIGDGIGTQGDVNVYGYAHDDHIDTALRTIMKEAGLDWAAGQTEQPKKRAAPRP